jgi:DNA-binding phage protein
MKRETSVSHVETIIRQLRKDRKFAAEYLKAALDDEEESGVLLIALRHLAQAQRIAKVAKAPELSERVCIGRFPLMATLICPRWLLLPEQLA